MKKLGALVMMAAALLASAGPCWSVAGSAAPCAMPDCADGAARLSAPAGCCCAAPGAPAGRTDLAAGNGTLLKGASIAPEPGTDPAPFTGALVAAHRTEARSSAPPLFLLNTSLLI